MKPASVSVVVPAYQAAWSIGDTVLSVLQQSSPVHEVIIVNDGSTDDVAAAIAQASSGDPRVVVIDQAYRGLAAARNRGLAVATGELVAFIDADDIWHPRFVELVGYALQADAHAPFAYAYSFHFDRQNRKLPSVLPARIPRHDFIGLLTLNSVGNGSAAIFRREPLAALGGFDVAPGRDHEHGAEDWKLALQLARGGSPALVPLPLVGYRRCSDSMSQAAPLRQYRAIQRTLSDMRRVCPEVPARHFADANTMMTGWLLMPLIRHESLPTVLRMLLRAYVLNPGWLRSTDLRDLHIRKLRELVASALVQIWPFRKPRRLASWEISDQRPFAYLATSRTGTSIPSGKRQN